MTGCRRGAMIAPILLAATVAASGCERAPPSVRSFALPAPEATEPAFEPHLSIDPGDSDRMIVAAHYGIGYNRGGRKMWTWQTADGGTTWSGAEVPAPDTAGLAADAVTSYAPRGIPYLAFVFADTTDRLFSGGAALTRGTSARSGFEPARVVARGGFDTPARAAVDKEWLAIDRGADSPHRGTFYVTYHLNRPGSTPGTVHSSLWLAASRDGGETFGEPLHLADGFRGQVAVRADGTVDAVFTHLDRAVLSHVSSVDGGRSFSPAAFVVDLGDSVTVDQTHLIATGENALLLCWSQTIPADSTRYIGRCTRSTDGVRWDAPTDVMPDLPENSSFGFPVTASAGAAVWLLGYLAGPDSTRVVLMRSADGGKTFVKADDLAERPLGSGRICIAAGGPCRRSPDAFFPGDYFGLAATSDMVAAAYVLPEGEGPTDRARVYLSVLKP